MTGIFIFINACFHEKRWVLNFASISFCDLIHLNNFDNNFPYFFYLYSLCNVLFHCHLFACTFIQYILAEKRNPIDVLLSGSSMRNNAFLWISLKKGECFDFNHSLGCVYPTLYIIRLLGRAYHFSLLICYPCSFYIHAFMLVALWE